MKRLTKKQDKIARLRVKYPEATQTELASKLLVSRQRVQQVLAQPKVQSRVIEYLDSDPRTKEKAVVKKIADKTEAKTVKVFQTKDGKIIYSEPLDDHNIQLRAAELTLELRGTLKKSLDITSDGNPIKQGPDIVINCADISEEKLDKLIAATAPKTDKIDTLPALTEQPKPETDKI